ncbi:MATE family efflux transporter [Rhizobium tubonense]|uniref:Multidrug export protein MepA n=1 Tax=Rhizobium tubonense TaxID=484088 RepID=A0A2W4EV73_9HYPH|nr:MATE family efflux transporter [Rhizobium tubonense]PZM17036.1 multidrug transporter MatE [Rhizobium tubonense]
MKNNRDNIFLTGWLPGVFARTAAPIVLITTINGLFVVVDAYFLGAYVGPAALSAVTLIFPGLMMLIALQALVSNGMASILARKLGAGDREGARQTFAAANALAIGLVLLLYALYWLAGARIIDAAAEGAVDVATNARSFMAVTIAFAPVAFFLSLNVDALRCEGRIGFMALVTIASSLLNILANWLLMAVAHWGVIGSAAGSVLAQFICLIAILFYRWRNVEALRPWLRFPISDWPRILSLGAPMSLGFIGMSLSSAAVIYNLSIWDASNYVATVGAYGIITRIMTFAYLPLLGINIAFQTICGNNYGAGLTQRVGRSLQIALLSALIYCAMVEIVVELLAGHLGGIFVADPQIIAATTRILPWMVASYFLFGQMIVLSGYFQALGDPLRAGAFGLARPYLFVLPLTFLLPYAFGETGIWMVSIAAEGGMCLLALLVLSQNARRRGWRYGLLPG